MLKAGFSSKYQIYSPLLVNLRWKVQILPKEPYGIDETMIRKPQASGKRTFIDIAGFLHRKSLWDALWDFLKKKKIQEIYQNQRFIPERHKILGPDLATAHFIMARNGKVKFSGHPEWMSKDDLKNKKIPSRYVPGYFVEEIDASGMNIFYEGFENLCSLTKLKKLKLCNCSLVDDWCLNRFHLFASTLECLDISGCHSVTERGICTLHNLKKLKTLIINDTPNIKNKELVCLLLQDILPECEITGVDFDNPVLLKRLETYMQ